MTRNSSGFSGEGAMFALFTGAVGGIGYALLCDDKTERLVKRAWGGALVVLSAYLFAPAALRRAWLD